MKNLQRKYYLSYGAAAAIAFNIPLVVFVNKADYSNGWLLFLGNFLFLFVIAGFLNNFNKRKNNNASTGALIAAGHIATLTGIILSVLFCILSLYIYAPTILTKRVPDKIMHSEPSNMIHDKTGGMNFMIYMSAVFGNFVAGFFVSILFPFSLKRDQTKEKVSAEQTEI